MEGQGTAAGRLAGRTHNLWWLAGLGALAAMKFYYVREMIAALMIFSALFAVGAAIVLIVFTLNHVTQRTFAWVEAPAMRLGRWAADGSAALMGHIALSSQRLRFSTVRSNWLSRRN